MSDATAMQAGWGWGNFGFIIFLILILIVFGMPFLGADGWI